MLAMAAGSGKASPENISVAPAKLARVRNVMTAFSTSRSLDGPEGGVEATDELLQAGGAADALAQMAPDCASECANADCNGGCDAGACDGVAAEAKAVATPASQPVTSQQAGKK